MPEIESAVVALSDADWYRLRRVGQIISLKTPTMDGEALLFEALERTIDGRRKWRPEAVDFVGHLIGAMRSIASHELERKGNKVVPFTSSVELIGLSDPTDPEEALSAEEQIRMLRAHFGEGGDSLALQVLDAMELGCDGSMIREQLSLSQNALQTVVRRIRRAAHRLLPT